MKLIHIASTLIISLSFNLSAVSKILNPDWKEGNVILETEGYFSGPVFIDSKNDVLLIKKGNQIKAYPAQKVKKLQFFDDELLVNRDFITYDFFLKNGSSKKIFLEIVLSGEVAIFRKEKAKSPPRIDDFLLERSQQELNMEHDFVYYAAIGNKLIDLNNFKKKIFPTLVKDTEEKLEKFKDKNNLKEHLLSHQIILIDYYNSIQNPFYKGLKSNLTAKN